jgi:hypothetical protein
LRLARAFERAAFEAAADDVEFHGEMKIVKLIDTSSHQDELAAAVLSENVSDPPQPNKTLT